MPRPKRQVFSRDCCCVMGGVKVRRRSGGAAAEETVALRGSNASTCFLGKNGSVSGPASIRVPRALLQLL
jgi:hypothetical protein